MVPSCLSLAAVAFWAAQPRRLGPWLGALPAALSVLSCVARWSVFEGLLVALLLAMAASSVLVLVLPMRRAWAFPLGVVSSLGALAALLAGA